jgi:hypothetical protein
MISEGKGGGDDRPRAAHFCNIFPGGSQSFLFPPLQPLHHRWEGRGGNSESVGALRAPFYYKNVRGRSSTH